MMKPGPRAISFRVSLIAAIPVLVLLIGAAITANSYWSVRANIMAMADSLFSQAIDQTAQRAASYLSHAVPAPELLASLLADDARDEDQLSRLLVQVLKANPGFTWVSFSEPDGRFTGAHRLAEGLVINRSHVEAGKTTSQDFSVQPDGGLRLLANKPESDYDPRTRTFYRQAVEAGTRVWTDPYVFYGEQVAGITCAVPVHARSRKLRGVVTVDIDLNALSRFAETIHVSEHAQVFVYSQSGVLLALAGRHVVAPSDSPGTAQLLTKKNVDDKILREYFQSGGGRTFEYQGAPYFCGSQPFSPEQGLTWNVGVVAPASDFLDAVDRTTRNSLILSLVALVAATMMGFRLASSIATPLEDVAREMSRIGTLDLRQSPASPSPFREITEINLAVAAMKGSLESFASYVPRDVVRALVASGHPATLGGRTDHLTVLFVDLANFNRLSEQLEPSQVVELLEGYFGAMTQVIASQGGTVDKFVGDAIMAFWNAPQEDPHHAASACQAALGCHRRMAEMKESYPAYTVLEVRIGIASGQVLIGNFGTAERMNYTALGDTVDFARRLDRLNTVYQTAILINPTTYEAACESIVMRAVDVVAVEGSETGIRLYEPLALKSEGDAEAAKRAWLSELALEAYLTRRFQEAAELYGQILSLKEDDKVARRLQERCLALQERPLPADWSGVSQISEN